MKDLDPQAQPTFLKHMSHVISHGEDIETTGLPDINKQIKIWRKQTRQELTHFKMVQLHMSQRIWFPRLRSY